MSGNSAYVDFWRATNNKWYFAIEMETDDDDDDDDYDSDSEVTVVGPFDTCVAAFLYAKNEYDLRHRFDHSVDGDGTKAPPQLRAGGTRTTSDERFVKTSAVEQSRRPTARELADVPQWILAGRDDPPPSRQQTTPATRPAQQSAAKPQVVTTSFGNIDFGKLDFTKLKF